MVIVVMGPTGAGKSTVGRALAESLGWRFLDADDLHPAENIAQIRSGGALSEEQRAPWLAAVAREVARAYTDHAPLVVACSALRRVHRDALRPSHRQHEQAIFVYLKVSRRELERRLASRTDHFAPPALLTSQLSTLEEPSSDADAFTVDAEQSVDKIVTAIRRVAFRNTP